jgi:ADP-ribose pyrophosphatase YjhB (NUDIX family)
MSSSIQRFCGVCGGALIERWLESEQRLRAVCSGCGSVAYQNPRVLVTTIVEAGERVLLCKRASAPAAGRWALPGGFMECGETLEEAAARETFEETGVRLNARELRLHALSTLPEISEVYVGFVATLGDLADLACGAECSEVRFFGEAEVPWAELTYPDVGEYLRVYFRERREGEQAIHHSRLDSAGVLSHAYRVVGIDEVRRLRADRSDEPA